MTPLGGEPHHSQPHESFHNQIDQAHATLLLLVQGSQNFVAPRQPNDATKESSLVAYNPGGSAYTGFNASPLPATTPDGEYTQFGSSYQPVYYEPGSGPGVRVGQMNTVAESVGGSRTVQTKVEVSTTVSAGFLGIFGQKTTYTVSDEVAQTNSWLTSLSDQQTITNAYQINGSSPPNYVDGEYLLYQDNFYGTFVFVPWQ